jgi:hypothetical protein
MIARLVAGEAIGHLDRRLRRLAPVEHPGEVFAGMAGSGLEQGDRAVRRFGDQPGSEDPGAVRTGTRRQRLDARCLG